MGWQAAGGGCQAPPSREAPRLHRGPVRKPGDGRIAARVGMLHARLAGADARRRPGRDRWERSGLQANLTVEVYEELADGLRDPTLPASRRAGALSDT